MPEQLSLFSSYTKMVADNIDAGAVAVAAADQSSAPSGVSIKDELPAGNYILVSVDIDTTGRRLIDEVSAFPATGVWKGQ